MEFDEYMTDFYESEGVFDKIIDGIRKFIQELIITARTKFQQLKVGNKLKAIERELAENRTLASKKIKGKKGDYTVEEYVKMYNSFIKDAMKTSNIIKTKKLSQEKTDKLCDELSRKYKDLSHKEIKILSTSVANATKANQKEFDEIQKRLSSIESIGARAVEDCKKYDGNDSASKSALKKVCNMIAFTTKKVATIVKEHPFISLGIIIGDVFNKVVNTAMYAKGVMDGNITSTATHGDIDKNKLMNTFKQKSRQTMGIRKRALGRRRSYLKGVKAGLNSTQ